MSKSEVPKSIPVKEGVVLDRDGTPISAPESHGSNDSYDSGHRSSRHAGWHQPFEADARWHGAFRSAYRSSGLRTKVFRIGPLGFLLFLPLLIALTAIGILFAMLLGAGFLVMRTVGALLGLLRGRY